jgi:putative transposase
MLLALLVLIVWSALFLIGYRWRKARPARPHYFRRPFSTATMCSRRKPEWVRKEIIRLKAHLPEHGCRKLADMFNRLFAAKGMTVSKSYVSDLLRQHAYEVADLRRTWKTRISPPLLAIRYGD